MTRESFVNLGDPVYTKCMLNLPQDLPNPVTTINIINHQAQDIQLQEQVQNDPDHYTHEEIHTFEVIVYIPNPTQHRIWKIVLPESIIQDVLCWYHVVLDHCGYQRLYNTIRARFHTKQLDLKCKQFVCQDNCQQYKQQ